MLSHMESQRGLFSRRKSILVPVFEQKGSDLGTRLWSQMTSIRRKYDRETVLMRFVFNSKGAAPETGRVLRSLAK